MIWVKNNDPVETVNQISVHDILREQSLGAEQIYDTVYIWSFVFEGIYYVDEILILHSMQRFCYNKKKAE